MSEFYPNVTRPLRGARAFREISEIASQPQAAILLMLARQLRGDDAALVARARAARAPARRVDVDLAGAYQFPVPRLRPSRKGLAGSEVRARAAKSYGHARRGDERALVRSYAACADRLYSRPTVDTAAELMEMCLSHPRSLVRIAAAFAYHPLTNEPGRCVRQLVRGVSSADRLEMELAATALARIQPEHRALRRLAGTRKVRVARGRAHTLTIVHGTWASSADWYQPGGGFFTFIKRRRADLYGAADFFSWSGGYSDAARAQGAVDLKRWVDDRHENGLDIMGHSHGANVILKSTQLGMTAGKVVLLSCPVHVNKYFPDFTRVTTPIYSVRVKLDLVILADRGGQRFSHPGIREIVLPIWFDHGASHDPGVWRAHGVAARIGL